MAAGNNVAVTTVRLSQEDVSPAPEGEAAGNGQQNTETAAFFVGPLGIWGMGVAPTEETAWSCGKEGCLVKSRHEHERRVDERLRQLRRINADFERRHPSLRES
jgi:hypothetical protein